MSNTPSGLPGLTGTVASPQTGAAPLTVFAAPSTTGEFNTLGERLVPKACFKVEDLLFDFASSFIRPDMKDHLPKLVQLRNDNQVQDPTTGAGIFPPLSIFGHADPVGDDDLNKVLSGRRATAFYAMLVRDTDLWETLFTSPFKNDIWGTKAIQSMLSTVQSPIDVDDTLNDETLDSIRTFQNANGLASDGKAGPNTRKVLFRSYMDALCGPNLELDKVTDFLARNQDGAGGKGDLQGCGEFNPLRVFSIDEDTDFTADSDKTDRNEANAPNRRVMVLLFAPGRKINPSVWPCPRVKEGVAACKKRFFPDAAIRRNPQDARREFEDTKDTFACRFYQIISDDSPCERVKPAPPPPALVGVTPLILFGIGEDTVTAVSAPVTSSLVSAPAAPVGAIKAVQDIVLVKKPYTNPKRAEIILKTDVPFDGIGLLNVNKPGTIQLFPTPAGGTALTFNGVDNQFKGAQLDPGGPGVHLFAEGKTFSTSVGDFMMTLHLTLGTKKPNPDAVRKMTAIELTLDICAPRVNAATAPVPLPQAPATPAAVPDDKVFLGRPIPIQDADKIQERAMLMVQPIQTAGFAALNRQLVLVRIGSNAITLTQETPIPNQADVVVAPRHTFFSANTPTTFFVEGQTESSKPRDNSYQLGIDGLDGDGDRVSVTVVHSEILSNKKLVDAHTVDLVPEIPAPVTRSTIFFTAPRIIGRDFPIELRPFVLRAVPTAFQWSASGVAALTLTDAGKQVLKLKATALSANLNDTLIQVLVTSDLGQFLRRHHFTVVHVTIDSVASGEIISVNDDINVIRNPSAVVILSGADANDPKKVAKIEMFKFADPGVPATKTKPAVPAVPAVLGIEPNLTWTADDNRISWWIVGNDGGQYTGQAAFRSADAAKHGTQIEVFGTKEGDVLIQPYSGGFGYGMFRASVIQLRQIKYRVNRISSPAVPAKTVLAHGPTRTHTDALAHIKMTNHYLRQLGIELIPDTSTEMASKTPPNSKIGVAETNKHVVSVTQSTGAGGTAGAADPGHFDVVVDQFSMTFHARDFGNSGAEGAVRVNARNEIITFAYIESLAEVTNKKTGKKEPAGTLAQAQLIPTNHAKGGVLIDKGVPSSSLIKKTGIPGDTPVSQVKLSVLVSFRVGPQPKTPANGDSNINLLWGISVPTTSIDTFAVRPDIAATGASPEMIYGATLAHEVGHVLGLRHRIPPGVKASPSDNGPDPFPDGIATPKTKNLMFPQVNPVTTENMDIVQAKAIRFSEVLKRNP